MAQKSPLGNHIEFVGESFDLRCISNVRKFGEKNPTENGKFSIVTVPGCSL